MLLCGSDQRSVNRTSLVQVKTKRHIGRTFDAIDADLTIALRSVSITGGKERASVQHRQIQLRACRELTYIHVASESSRRPGAKLSLFRRRNTHHTAKG